MRKDELVEQFIMIAVLVGFLVHIFTGYDPRWFHALLYYVSPIVLAVILVRRYRRMQEGFDYSRKIVDAQHQATGANVLGRQNAAGGPNAGPQSSYPGVALPDQVVEGIDMDLDQAENAEDTPGAEDIPDGPDVGGIPGISGNRPEDDR
ncbi:MAG: hypothetical protein ACOC7J_04590 [Armatimonadota bacterium]